MAPPIRSTIRQWAKRGLCRVNAGREHRIRADEEKSKRGVDGKKKLDITVSYPIPRLRRFRESEECKVE